MSDKPEVEFTSLDEVFASLMENEETGEPVTVINAAVQLTYNGVVTKEAAGELLNNALEHCRTEGLLSDPEWLNDPATEDLGCDAVRCRIL